MESSSSPSIYLLDLAPSMEAGGAELEAMSSSSPRIQRRCFGSSSPWLLSSGSSGDYVLILLNSPMCLEFALNASNLLCFSVRSRDTVCTLLHRSYMLSSDSRSLSVSSRATLAGLVRERWGHALSTLSVPRGDGVVPRCGEAPNRGRNWGHERRRAEAPSANGKGEEPGIWGRHGSRARKRHPRTGREGNRGFGDANVNARKRHPRTGRERNRGRDLGMPWVEGAHVVCAGEEPGRDLRVAGISGRRIESGMLCAVETVEGWWGRAGELKSYYLGL